MGTQPTRIVSDVARRLVLKVGRGTYGPCLRCQGPPASGARAGWRPRRLVGGQQMPDNRAIVCRPTIPAACRRTRIDPERRVHRADLRPAPLGRFWTGRYLRDQAARDIAEPRLMLGAQFDRISILVHIVVV